MNTETAELNEIFAEAEISATEVRVEDAVTDDDLDTEIIDLSDDDMNALEALDEALSLNIGVDENENVSIIDIDDLDITE